MACPVPERLETRMIGMGQMLISPTPAILTAVLGSCVGVAIHCPRLRLGGLAHVVLPRSSGQASWPGKFADVAIPAMIEELEKLGAPRTSLVAKIAGGACMFGNGGPLRIGATNVEAVLQTLDQARIPLLGQDVGGNKGRRVRLHSADGVMVVEMMGCPPRNL